MHKEADETARLTDLPVDILHYGYIPVDKETLVRIAEISRLRLSEHEADALQKDMEEILKQFSVIQQINTEHVKAGAEERKQELRKDYIERFSDSDAILSQFCRKSNRHMLAPKGLE